MPSYGNLSLFFFFSSRRRHTRFDCDWSSDVCSSDLSVCFPEMASVGSSHNRPTSAEDHEEALLLGCPPIGRSDREWRAVRESSSGEKEGPYILGLKTPRLYGPPGKACFFSIGRVSVVAALL